MCGIIISNVVIGQNHLYVCMYVCMYVCVHATLQIAEILMT